VAIALAVMLLQLRQGESVTPLAGDESVS